MEDNPAHHEVIPLKVPEVVEPDLTGDTLTPSRFSNKRKEDPSEVWKKDLETYMEKEMDFLDRCRDATLTDRDIGQICIALECSGTAGATLELFAAKLRLIEKEMVTLIKKYPQIERSLRISQANRKGALTENLIRSSATNANAAKELINNPELAKNLFDKENEFDSGQMVHERVVEKLLERGAKPRSPTQVVFLTGHKENLEENPDAVMAKAGWIPAEEFLRKLG